jgi:hypothetical protein
MLAQERRAPITVNVKALQGETLALTAARFFSELDDPSDPVGVLACRERRS